ncbi:biosynthetic-type acetolactate synthase large subunit [Liquorilactobacillus satsumensis]|uniref:biosynthetic-type acetolactate synthase large subunit n=1 Tax=Liquorilactobacillus satsumensis TaxID=259059 RepID=UPI0021C37A0E|nr:biosynthetic-type acetolactate synthase large subunit [Liquorilactobacillus satsumensis]MCP9313038.1 biosynthetic-type acetolactate synthase large subunit [Liquorilactobacillus satsumensis]MCP9360194.1 biosynthetic-type acetolactate synthase large subunit [Liquorilactobacillus satsumensis]
MLIKRETEKTETKRTLASGADLLLEALKVQGVELVFGYPGGAVLPLYDAIYRQAFNNILVRHEQAAVHAAEGYAKATGKTGVVFVTSGPGATNTVTGIADAMLDSIPLVVFTGQVGCAVIGTDAFQEVNILSITAAITKQSYQVHDSGSLAEVVKEAFAVASSGRPGPVVVDLPKDVAAMAVDEQQRSQTAGGFTAKTPVYPQRKLAVTKMQQLRDALLRAQKPLLLVGGGVIAAGAVPDFRRFVHRYKLPVVSTLLSLGALPVSDPFSLGMGGMHGSYQANLAFSECDFLLNIGSRFDDRLATNTSQFAPKAQVAQIDIDDSEFGKMILPDFAVAADAKEALNWLLAHPAKTQVRDHQAWLQQLSAWQHEHPQHYVEEKGKIKPQAVIAEVGRLTAGDATIVTDVGQHQMWTAQYYPFTRAHQLITSGGLGTMGFGLPAAIGAKLAVPEKEVVLFVGDGGLQMTSEELDVIRDYRLNIKIILLNNQTLGMVRQWQDLFYKKRRSQTVFNGQPDFIKLAHAYGLKGLRLASQNWRETLADVFATQESVLVEARIPALEQVYPMVAPGQPNQKMLGVD